MSPVGVAQTANPDSFDALLQTMKDEEANPNQLAEVIPGAHRINPHAAVATALGWVMRGCITWWPPVRRGQEAAAGEYGWPGAGGRCPGGARR
jgi:hypothetical protein